MIKQVIKVLAGVLVLAAGIYIWGGLAANSKKEMCFGATGKPAVDACSALVKWKKGADRAEALYRRSRLYSHGEAWDKEKADLEELAKNPGVLPKDKLAAVYVGLAVAYGRSGDQAAALKYSELAVQSGVSDPGTYISLAGSYIEAKQFQQAVSLLESSPIPQDQKGHPYYTALAAAYGGTGDYGKAYSTLKTALEVKAPRPVLANTAKQMGLVCFELKRYKEAEMYLSYASRSGADCPECGLLLTTIRESLANY